MNSLFHYSYLDIHLTPETRSMTILLKSDEDDGHLTLQTIFELETIAAWLTSHIEIQSVLITSVAPHFSLGLRPQFYQSLDTIKFQKILLRLQKLIYGLSYLPQTTMIDLKLKAGHLGAELALACDLRLIAAEGSLTFNHLGTGLAPSCGTMGLLGQLIGYNRAKNWILTGQNIGSQELKNSGFVTEIYSCEEERLRLTQTIQAHIAAQAPVERIQTKRAFLDMLMPIMDKGQHAEQIFSNACLVTEDWRKSQAFYPAKDFAQYIKSFTSEEAHYE